VGANARVVGRFFSEGIQSFHPEEYRGLLRNLTDVRYALEAQARETGTQEARALHESFRELERLVGTAKLDAVEIERQLAVDTRTYEGAGPLFKTIDQIRAQLPKVLEMEAQAETAAAARMASAATASAEVEVAEVAVGTGGRAAATASEAEAAEGAAQRATGETTARLGLGRGAMIGNVFLTLAAIVGTAISAWNMTPERQAKIALADAKAFATEGAKVATAWKSQPDATDAYVFGASTSQVCDRAARDPKGFGKVVGEKMGAVEYWDALRRTLAQRNATIASAEPLPGGADKRFGPSTEPRLQAGVIEKSASGELAL
jgi:hypothetical protein